MERILKEAFEKLGVEYYSVIAYSDVREYRSDILERAELDPSAVIVYLLPYYVSTGKNLSVYSTSLDYHLILREISENVIDRLKLAFPQYEYRGFGDHSPIDERYAALISGLGILGDNGLLINEKYGSYVFIGEIITSAPPELLGAISPQEIKHCPSCGACQSACPTGILRGESDECLSEITQRKGELDERCAEMMRKVDTVWGCDLCQSACPYNKDPQITPIDFFKKDRTELLTTDLINGLSKEEFAKRAFAWRGRKTVLRNLNLLKY